jgi:hypothetical protein
MRGDKREDMKKGNIILPINKVWELLNKPRRLIFDIKDQVEALPIGEYEYLNFDKKTKAELLKRLDKITLTGKLINL